MHIPSFKIERYFARYEFSVPYILCASDCEPLTLPELLDTSICSSAPSQVLSVMGLQAKDMILERNLSLIAHNKDVTNVFVDKYHDLFSWCPPQAGSTAFITYLADEGAAALSERLVKDEGILVIPSTVFDYGDKHWRIGLGRKNVPEILARLDSYLEKNR